MVKLDLVYSGKSLPGAGKVFLLDLFDRRTLELPLFSDKSVLDCFFDLASASFACCVNKSCRTSNCVNLRKSTACR